MEMTNILAAVDTNDDFARAVLATAADLAGRYGAGLHVVSVWPVGAAIAARSDSAGFPMEMSAPSARVEETARAADAIGRDRHC